MRQSSWYELNRTLLERIAEERELGTVSFFLLNKRETSKQNLLLDQSREQSRIIDNLAQLKTKALIDYFRYDSVYDRRRLGSHT